MNSKKVAAVAAKLIEAGNHDLARQVVEAAKYDDEPTQKQLVIEEIQKLQETCDRMQKSLKKGDYQGALQSLVSSTHRDAVSHLIDDLRDLIKLSSGK